MKKTALVALSAITLTAATGTAQTQQKVQPAPKEVVHTTADVMPEPNVNVQDFLFKNLQYPEAARKRKAEGRVVIRFVVAEDGSLTDAIVERGVDPLLDTEALQTVRKMPKWRPGLKNGKPVKVYYRIPVSFKLT